MVISKRNNITEAFIHLVYQYEKQAKITADHGMQQATTKASDNFKAAGSVLNLFIDSEIPDDTPFVNVKKKAFKLLHPDNFTVVMDYMQNVAYDKACVEWSFYSTLSHKLVKSAQPLKKVNIHD